MKKLFTKRKATSIIPVPQAKIDFFYAKL